MIRSANPKTQEIKNNRVSSISQQLICLTTRLATDLVLVTDSSITRCHLWLMDRYRQSTHRQ